MPGFLEIHRDAQAVRPAVLIPDLTDPRMVMMGRVKPSWRPPAGGEAMRTPVRPVVENSPEPGRLSALIRYLIA
jgi:hypothetical protein